MALKLEEIRVLAERVAASHGLDVVDLEYQGGGGKHRTLRVFIEKNEQERAKLRERVAGLQAKREGALAAERRQAPPVILLEDEQDVFEDAGGGREQLLESGTDETVDDGIGSDAGRNQGEDEDEALLAGLPSVENLEFLSGITHRDCELFSQDFGLVLDVEELVPGTEYLLEVSSPGLDRRLTAPADYRRFIGSLVKLQTFEAVAGNRHWQGRLAGMEGETLVLDLKAKQNRKKPAKGVPETSSRVEISLGNVEKAHLVPEF